MTRTNTTEPDDTALATSTASLRPVYRHQPCSRPKPAMAAIRITMRRQAAENNSLRSGSVKSNLKNQARVRETNISRAWKMPTNQEFLLKRARARLMIFISLSSFSKIEIKSVYGAGCHTNHPKQDSHELWVAAIGLAQDPPETSCGTPTAERARKPKNFSFSQQKLVSQTLSRTKSCGQGSTIHDVCSALLRCRTLLLVEQPLWRKGQGAYPSSSYSVYTLLFSHWVAVLHRIHPALFPWQMPRRR